MGRTPQGEGGTLQESVLPGPCKLVLGLPLPSNADTAVQNLPLQETQASTQV